MRAEGDQCYRKGKDVVRRIEMVSKMRIDEDAGSKPVRKPRILSPAQEAEKALERQIRQIERNFGPDWKW
jgi:hypothetical protein